MARNDPPPAAMPVSWATCPRDMAAITIVRAELVKTDGSHRISILRELRCGDVVVAGGPVWSRSTDDAVEAADVFEGLALVGDHLVYLAEAALVLPSPSVDDVVDQHLKNAAEAREKERAKAAEKAAKAEAKALRDRTIAVYFVDRRGKRTPVAG